MEITEDTNYGINIAVSGGVLPMSSRRDSLCPEWGLPFGSKKRMRRIRNAIPGKQLL